MDRYTMMVAITALICGTVMLGVLGQAIVSLRSKRAPELPADRLRAIEDRLVQVQDSVDSIAIEVERVAEAQRFQARLLSERVERT